MIETWFGFSFQSFAKRERLLLRLLVAAGLLYLMVHVGYSYIGITEKKFQRDFAAYYAASVALNLGEPIHNLGPWPLNRPNVLAAYQFIPEEEPPPVLLYVYPPFLAWVLTPLTWLDYPSAERIWNILNMTLYGCAIGLLLASAKAVAVLNRREITILALLGVLWSPAMFTVWGGQITIAVLFCLAAHVWAALKARDVLAGTMLGLAVLLKVAPVVLLVFWVLQCRWKTAASCIVTVLLGVGFSGWQQTWHFVTVLFPHIAMGENHPANLSLMGILLTQTIGDPWGWVNAEEYRRILWPHTALKLLLAAGWVAVLWGVWKKANQNMLALHMALMLCSLLVLSPVTRIYDFVYLYPALMFAYLDWRDRKNPTLLAAMILAGLFFVMNVGDVLQWIPYLGGFHVLVDKSNVIVTVLFWMVLLGVQKFRMANDHLIKGDVKR